MLPGAISSDWVKNKKNFTVGGEVVLVEDGEAQNVLVQVSDEELERDKINIRKRPRESQVLVNQLVGQTSKEQGG